MILSHCAAQRQCPPPLSVAVVRPAADTKASLQVFSFPDVVRLYPESDVRLNRRKCIS